jgi:hypothetical protein
LRAEAAFRGKPHATSGVVASSGGSPCIVHGPNYGTLQSCEFLNGQKVVSRPMKIDDIRFLPADRRSDVSGNQVGGPCCRTRSESLQKKDLSYKPKLAETLPNRFRTWSDLEHSLLPGSSFSGEKLRIRPRTQQALMQPPGGDSRTSRFGVGTDKTNSHSWSNRTWRVHFL